MNRIRIIAMGLFALSIALVLAACTTGTVPVGPVPATITVPAPTAETASPLVPETQTVKVRIIGDDQLALPEWNIVSDTSALPAQCQSFPSPYAIGPNIQYCSPHVDGADVCWAPPGQHFIYCGNTPWDHTVRKIFATDVVSAVPASIDPQPWAIELADGTRCPAKFENGNRQGANGTLALYTCDSGLNVMAKDNDHVIDTSNPIWTVIVGEVDGGTGSTAPPGKRVAVKAVYYAA